MIGASASHSLNAEPVHDEHEAVKYVKEFQQKAKVVTGEERKKFRKAPPPRSISTRVQEVVREEEEKELHRTRYQNP